MFSITSISSGFCCGMDTAKTGCMKDQICRTVLEVSLSMITEEKRKLILIVGDDSSLSMTRVSNGCGIDAGSFIDCM